MDRLSKLYNENRRAVAMGGALMFGAASALYLYRRRQVPAAYHKWRDVNFKSENLNCYSSEANIRAQ